MNSQQTELFDLAILRVLDANRTRFGLSWLAVSHHLPQFGFTAASSGTKSADEFQELIADRIEYLTNKLLVEECLKVVSRENRAWRITKAGIRHLDERG